MFKHASHLSIGSYLAFILLSFSSIAAPNNSVSDGSKNLAENEQPTRLRVTNRCAETIWLQYAVGSGASDKGGILGPPITRLEPGQFHDYPIPQGRLEATRFWPKTACDRSGQNCKIGQSLPPCPSKGCTPPIESKFEATFADIDCASDSSKCMTYWNASHVDGYTLPISVFPKGPDVLPPGSSDHELCTESRCDALDLSQCPTSEFLHGKWLDLRLFDSSAPRRILGCMSPCKKFTYPPPYGEGQSEYSIEGRQLCCPEGVSPEECRAGPLSKTQYVQYIHRTCPRVYAYPYDDHAGLHKCTARTKYEVVFCAVRE